MSKQTPNMHAECSYCRLVTMTHPYWPPNNPKQTAQQVVAYHRGDWLKAWRFICHVWKHNLRKFGDNPNWAEWIDRIRQVREEIYGLKFSGENPA